MISIQRYTPEHKRLWDEFVAKSKNATFLHFRDYMDYHADRFTDHSLMAFDAKGNVLALLPANIDGDTLHSHQGLTYGGWLTPIKHFNASTMLELFDATIQTLKKTAFARLSTKPSPTSTIAIPPMKTFTRFSATAHNKPNATFPSHASTAAR